MSRRPDVLEVEDPAALAAHWVERLTSGEASGEEIKRLRDWLDEDPENRRSYERARAIWTGLSETKLARIRRPRLELAGGTALAASLALAFVLSTPVHDHSTSVGEVQRLVLPDGSTVWLDSKSAIDVAFGEKRRTIRLAQGRLAIDAVKDAGRPLAIEADNATITDIGTVFSVDVSRGLNVAVAQGLVSVAQGGRKTRIGAGRAASFDGPSPRVRSTKTGELAWRNGRIVLDQLPLDQALAELNRYYSGGIILGDRSLGSRKVSGTLFADRAEQGVEALAASQGLRVTRLPWLMIVRR